MTPAPPPTDVQVVAPPSSPSTVQNVQQAPPPVAKQTPNLDSFIKQTGGTVVDASKMNPAQAMAADVHGDDFLRTLPPALGTQVKAFAEGRRAFPTGIAQAKPEMLQMLQLVGQYDPTFDQTDFNKRNRTAIAFSSGKQSGQLNNLRTAIEHLESLAVLGDNLHNRELPAWNWLANKVATGTGADAVTNYKQNAGRVGEELTSAYRGAGGAEADIKRELENFNENMSPTQLNGSVRTAATLLADKADELQRQYDEGMGAAGKGFKLLKPSHESLMEHLKSRGVGQSTPALPVTLSPNDVGKTFLNSAGKTIKVTAVNPSNPKQFKFDEVK